MRTPSECARCGFEFAVDAKFCGGCGTPARGGGSLAPVRKHVCVLFVDIVGSTGLAEMTDPEALRTILARYFDTVSRAIWQFGGTVEKFIGDAVMAVFGVPTTHEDDALRAVRAARKIIDDVAGLPGGGDGRCLEVRIGVNAGEVFVTQQPDGQFSVTGDAVNVAARLQSRAAPGEVYVGRSVADLVGSHVDLEFLGETVHRGKSAAEAHYRLTGRKREDAGLHTMSFVGRDLELRELAAVVDRVVRRRQGWSVTLVGDAGLGKSRLLHELLLTQPDAVVMKGSAQPTSTDASSFAILDELLADAAPDWPALVRGLLGDDAAPVLGRLESAVGHGDAQTSLEDVAWALGRLVARIAEDRPVILVWDDLHWASDLQLDLVQLLTQELRQSATLTMCLARPELFDQRPWWGGGPRSRVETIEALSKHHLKMVAEDWRRANGAGEERVDVAIRRSDGNPLVLRMLLESKADEALPMSVHALFEAALDRLDPNERAFCEAGAVFGRKFDRSAAAWVMQPAPGVDMDRIVRRLTSINVLEAAAAAGGAAGDHLAFSQSLLMQKAYLSVPKQIRADRHVRAAGWLATRRANTGEPSVAVFLHLYRALENLRAIHGDARQTEALREKAITAGLPALMRQVRRGDAALAATARGLARIVPNGDERLIDVVLTVWLGRGERGGHQAFGECLATADATLRASVTWTKIRRIPEWMDALTAGQLTAEDHLADAVGLIAELSASPAVRPTALLFAYFYASQVVADLDGPVGCMEYLLRGAEIARSCGHAGAERVFMSSALQSSLAANDTLDITIRLGERMCTELSGVRRALPMVQGVLAAAYALAGESTTAHDVWDGAAEQREALPPAARPFVEQYFCDVLVAEGKLGEAARRYAELARETNGIPTTFVDLESFAARLSLYAGDVDSARRHLATARSSAVRVGSPHRFDRRLTTLEASVAAACGQPAQAPATMPTSGEDLDERTGWLERGYTALDRAIGYAFAGDAERAAALRDEAKAAFSVKGAVALGRLVDAPALLSAGLDKGCRADAA